MKNQVLLKKTCWLLVIGFVSALALSACKSTDEHPKKSEHPEHPMTNAAPQNAK
jgi:preprotein translocase subunit SecG